MSEKKPEQEKTGLSHISGQITGAMERAELLRRNSSTAPIYGICDRHHFDRNPDGTCPVCEDLAKIDREGKDRAAKANLERLLGGIRLGARYRGKTFEDYVPTCKEAAVVKKQCEGFAKNFADRLTSGDNLLMLGNYGTGKNALAAAICQEIAGAGFSSIHTTVLKMLRRIKSTWNRKSEEDEQTVIDAFIIPDLLVVDEIGVQFGSETEKLILFEALNGRYEDKKPTILISNLTEPKELADYLGARVMDRMREGQTGILKFGWKSHRGTL